MTVDSGLVGYLGESFGSPEPASTNFRLSCYGSWLASWSSFSSGSCSPSHGGAPALRTWVGSLARSSFPSFSSRTAFETDSAAIEPTQTH